MKKFLPIFILLFLFFAPLTRVRAEIEPLFRLIGCDDPNKVCEVAPEKITRILNGETQLSEDCDPRTDDCTNKLWRPILNQPWSGIVKPLNDIYHYGTDLLTKFGAQIQESSVTDLTPDGLQTLTQHDVKPKRFCVTGRLCIYSPQNHALVWDSKTSKEMFCTEDDPSQPPKRIELIEGTRRLASYTTQYQIGTDYRLPETIVKLDKALPCDATWDPNNLKMNENEIVTVGKNNYYIKPDYTPLVNTGDITVTPYECARTKNGDIIWCYKKHEITPAKELGSAENSMAGSLAGISYTVSMADLEPFKDSINQSAREQLTKVGGLWNIYRNDGFDVGFMSGLDARYDNPYGLQQWDVTLSYDWEKQSPTQQSMNARQENSQLFGNLSMLPAGLQPIYFPDIPANKSWTLTGGNRTPAPSPGPGTPSPGPGTPSPGPGTPSPGPGTPSPGPGTPSPGPGTGTPLPPAPPGPGDPGIPGTRNPRDGHSSPPQCSNYSSIGPGSGPNANLNAAIAGASVWAGIPGCVLAGIADIEGAAEEMAQNSCIPNQCGAAGPFQISVGVDTCGSNTCDTCGPGWGGRACNDEIWALAQAGGSKADACNVNISAKAAAAVVMGKATGLHVPFTAGQTTFNPNNAQQKQSIIIADDAYYGATSPIARLGGLSYGEYVYQTCLRTINPFTSYTHQDHSFP